MPMLVNNLGGGLIKFANYACTILARDWKGFNTYGSNAVLEESNNGDS